MGRKSKIEGHPKADEIIKRLASGEEYSEIVRDFPELTWDDLDYYAKNKLPQILSKSKDLQILAGEIESADVYKGDTYLQLVVGLQKKALDALDHQDPKGDPKSWAMISREARGYLELLGRALDRISDRPVNIYQQINIYDAPQWAAVGEALAEILEPHPEIRAKVAKALFDLAKAEKEAQQ